MFRQTSEAVSRSLPSIHTELLNAVLGCRLTVPPEQQKGKGVPCCAGGAKVGHDPLKADVHPPSMAATARRSTASSRLGVRTGFAGRRHAACRGRRAYNAAISDGRH